LEAEFNKCLDTSLHPGKQASIVLQGSEVGILGELHPKVAKAFDIQEPVYIFELDVTTLISLIITRNKYRPIPRFPDVVRDMAIVLNSEISYARVRDIIEGFPLIEKVIIFDMYEGKQVPQGKKSLGYRITFRSLDHTLTEKEVDKVLQQIINKLSSELGAVLRS
jgi:phenylalanyl-tRNA synthetase beta chain